MTESETVPNDAIQLNEIDQIIHAPARLMIMALLYVVTSMDYVFLKNQTGLSWGNLASHLKKLEDSGYVEIIKGYQGKKPQSTIKLTKTGRESFKKYKENLQQIINDLPE